MESNKTKMLLLIAMAEGIVITGLILGLLQGWISMTAFIVAMVVVSSLMGIMITTGALSKSSTPNDDTSNENRSNE